ncbi:MAG: hypothetical protein U9P36_08695, partial [Thermodesulfobacteriota bacterium]|nr:hypothetical protein [Thermodesulfobacteriota bacterium]
IYEIANPFSFLGTTYIDSGWAAARAENPGLIKIDPSPACSMTIALAGCADKDQLAKVFRLLPKPVLYSLAANSTDPDELVMLARNCCRMEFDRDNQPIGLQYLESKGDVRADIDDFELFETIANNSYLPDRYKEVMVLRPGVQGGSEIVGDQQQGASHIFEYLRRNSYIPWGHYAANMAHDAVRYHTADLTLTDFRGLRHLYYQRMVVSLADRFEIPLDVKRRSLTEQELEQLRIEVLAAVDKSGLHPATLWGWNFGYDFSGSGYRLHASHQMIHQQFALVPDDVELLDGGRMVSYSCGDQVAEVVEQYRQENKSDFFSDYIHCIYSNKRSGGEGEKSLVVYADDNVMLFVPKAQVSQWELQLMVTGDREGQPVGNVLEADAEVRASIDRAILMAQHIFAGLGAKMVTSIEYSKRLGIQNGQRLLYAFLPKLPWSMGAFSEAQQRYICGHFPEDFAIACRDQMTEDRRRKSE